MKISQNGFRDTFKKPGGTMRYDIILFDADDTLFDFKKTEEFALEDALKKAGIAYDKDFHLREYKEVNSRIWKEFEEGKIGLKELKTERFRRYFSRIEVDMDHLYFADIYMDSLGDGSFLLEGAKELIEDLVPHTRLAIITNGLSKVQDKRIRGSVISHHFETIVVSEEVEVAKPSPEIFTLTLEEMGVERDASILMVGDSLASDIQGGINYGIDTCWYNPQSKKNRGSIRPTYEITSLEELRDIIFNC